MTSRLAIFLFLLLGSLSAYAATYSEGELKWFTLETEHFNVHYHEGLERLAESAAGVAESAFVDLTVYFDWIPADKTEMVLTDRVDYSNGMATPLPRNTMFIFATPPDNIESLEDHGGWLETVIYHEFTHILHLDMAYGVPAGMRAIFGRMNSFGWLFSFPNTAQPR